MNPTIQYLSSVALVILICGGCGGRTAQVSGTVQRNGKAIPGGSVLFRPLSSDGKAAVGEIQPDGTFQMMTDSPGDGVLIGQYRVVVAGQRGATDPALRTTYMGPADKPVDVVAGKQNELVINVSEPGWEAIRGDAE
jgi:hypothetical protein